MAFADYEQNEEQTLAYERLSISADRIGPRAFWL